MLLQSIRASKITIDIKKPTHLMIVHDGDMQGVFRVARALGDECKAGIFVSHPKGMADIILKGLASTESGVNLSNVRFTNSISCYEMLPDIIRNKMIGVIRAHEPMLDSTSPGDSDTHKAISRFIELLRYEEDSGSSSFIIMNGMLPIDVATINGMARAKGVFCLTVVHQKTLFSAAPGKGYDAINANHKAVFNSSGIYSARVIDGKLKMEYSHCT